MNRRPTNSKVTQHNRRNPAPPRRHTHHATDSAPLPTAATRENRPSPRSLAQPYQPLDNDSPPHQPARSPASHRLKRPGPPPSPAHPPPSHPPPSQPPAAMPARPSPSSTTTSTASKEACVTPCTATSPPPTLHYPTHRCYTHWWRRERGGRGTRRQGGCDTTCPHREERTAEWRHQPHQPQHLPYRTVAYSPHPRH